MSPVLRLFISWLHDQGLDNLVVIGKISRGRHNIVKYLREGNLFSFLPSTGAVVVVVVVVAVVVVVGIGEIVVEASWSNFVTFRLGGK